MKLFTIGVCGLAMITCFGCGETAPTQREKINSMENTTQPARTTDKPVVEKAIAGEANKTFSLSMPFEAVALTQGEQRSVLIGINRGEDFREEVLIEVSDLPTGVTLATTDPAIRQGSTDVTLEFKAASDAALGDFTVIVTGHTVSSGADFIKELKMTVAAK